jgi:F0F1-type ATP synthase delta subunit
LIKQTLSPKILGGLQIRIGSKIIDASLKNQIEQIKKECLSAIN